MKNLREEFELYKRLKRENGTIDIKDEHLKKSDVVVIPESSSDLIMNVAKRISDTVLILEKRSIDEIMTLLNTQPMQKAEKKKLFRILHELDHLSMHSIPGNQRWRFEKILFKPIHIDESKSVLLLDDSSFSGTTLKAMKAAVSHFDECEVLFSY